MFLTDQRCWKVLGSQLLRWSLLYKGVWYANYKCRQLTSTDGGMACLLLSDVASTDTGFCALNTADFNSVGAEAGLGAEAEAEAGAVAVAAAIEFCNYEVSQLYWQSRRNRPTLRTAGFAFGSDAACFTTDGAALLESTRDSKRTALK